MKFLSTRTVDEPVARTGRFGSRAALGVGLLLSLAPGSLTADPGEGLSFNGPGGVGTLPATKEDGLGGLPLPTHDPMGTATTFGSSSGSAGGAPGFVLRGQPDELNALIALAYGPGASASGTSWYELSSIAPDGTRQIVFHGPLVLELDRAVLGSSGVALGLAVEPQSAGALSAETALGRAAWPLPVGETWLPMQRIVRSGLLEEGLSLQTFRRGPFSPRLGATLDLRLERGRLVIEVSP